MRIRAVAFLIRRPPKANALRERFEWATLLGIGYARMRDFERADHHFEIASGLVRMPLQRAGLAYQIARRYMLEGRLAERAPGRRRDVWRQVVGDAHQSRVSRVVHSQPGRALSRGSRRDIRAIKLIGAQRSAHLEVWFHAVQNLALLGRELSFPEAVELARTEIDEDVEWPADFAAQRFQALKAVGWSCALRGDLLGCFRYLRAAERTRPSLAFEAIVLLDRAYFARIVGEDELGEQRGRQGRDAFRPHRLERDARRRTPGPAADGRSDGRIQRGEGALLPRALQESRSYALARTPHRFRSPQRGVCRLQRRFREAKSGAAGAEEALRKAWIVFDRIGYDWRAGRTALSLSEATKKDRWRHLAEDKLEGYPRSWLAREVAASLMPPVKVIKLPPMQRKVLDMLCQKMNTKEIAAKLGLSPHTIRNHLKAVFRAYDVNNRTALIAEIAQRGELPANA